jgi:tRNA(fMet)-specific endonuclease VapC
MRYLLDTDWVIDHLKGVAAVTRRLGLFVPDGLALSVVSLAELYEGVYYSREPRQAEGVLNLFLAPELSVLGIDQETARIFGRERGRLRREGRTIGDFDLLITSTCLQHNLVLLTNNRRHFELVNGLSIISV